MYQIRKSRKYYTVDSTDAVMLNPESFRDLSIPFTGETEEDFLFYVSDNLMELEEISEELDPETQSELNKLIEPEWNLTYCSAWDGEDNWLETGDPEVTEHFSVVLSTEI
jgi:hypothetical protein